MGHIINPVSLRLGLIRFWPQNNVPSYIKNYPYLHDYYYNLKKFIDWFFDTKIFETNAIILANTLLFNTHKKTHLILYVLNIKTYDNFRELTSKINATIFSQYFKNIELQDEETQRKLKLFCNLYIKCLFNLIEHATWLTLKTILAEYLQRFNRRSKSLKKDHEFAITIYNADPNNLNYNAQIIANFIKIRLLQRYRLLEVIRPVINHLNSLETVDGFKISCSGRFTRKELATYSWFKKKRVPLNTISSPIDYYQKHVLLKYGTCGIKVWLTHKNIQKHPIETL